MGEKIINFYYLQIKKWIPRSVFKLFSPLTKKYAQSRARKFYELNAKRDSGVQSKKEIVMSQRLEKKNETAVILHIYYEDLWNEIRSYLMNLDDKFDLYVSTRSDFPQKIFDEIKRIYPDSNIFFLENRGRDILPFLNILKKIESLEYKYILKLHTKKSPHRLDGDLWRKDLLDSMAGNKERTVEIEKMFEDDPKVGMVVANKYFTAFDQTTDPNREKVIHFLEKLGINKSKYSYPSGSIFWFRPEAMKPLLGLKLTPEDFEEESGQLDGTTAHAIERVFCVAAEKAGYETRTV